ncbi:MAG: hypothetical protein ACRD5M_15940 [Candidatus Acidiferrales bacterium]
MWRKIQPYVLAGLLVVAVVAYLANRNQGSGIAGVVAANGKFTPLSVNEPQLRLDLLEILKKDYPSTHRDIFNYGPPPLAVKTPEEIRRERPPIGPQPLPPPPPVQVPGEFFGYALTPATGKRVAFFKQGDDVLVVAEGDTFLNNYRLIHIGNDSADVEQISDHRHATVPMLQPATGDQGAPQ